MKILIQKVTGRTATRYIFRSAVPSERLFTGDDVVTGGVYHDEQQYWSAPAEGVTLQQLTAYYGRRCLKWTFTLYEAAAWDGGSVGVSVGQEKPYVGERPSGQSTGVAPHWREALLRTEEELRVKRYSWRTIKSYLGHLRRFFAEHPTLTPESVDTTTVRRYIIRRAEAGNYAASTQNQLLNALKFWLERIEGHEKTFIELRPKQPQQLPQVLSVDEIRRLFAATDNLKHRCILKLIYGGGLRLSELCNVRLADIYYDRLQIFVKAGKGAKDRYTTLPNSLVEELTAYQKVYAPTYWLFEGRTGGTYSVRSVQAIMKRAVKRSGVNAYATVHTLRHSYATHLLEQGTSLRHIQELLGHHSSRTTERYTHVTDRERARVVSPLDRLGEGE